MSYKALYRTYRPDDFNGMAGQKHIVKTLENAIKNDQIAHAYLFTGPRGTGKTSSAKIFAKAINCMAEESKPCNICDSCLAAQDSTHQDIIEIDAASNNGVEEARNLIERVKYAPSPLGKFKVYIIDEVHMMSTGAFNALLKTIEEPPAHVIFILATTEPHKVIPTIISRCQRFDFNKINKKEIVKRMQFIIDKEGIKVEDKVLDNIAMLADGGMRDALSILDQCRAYAIDTIKVNDVNEIYGVVSVEDICDLIHLVKCKNVPMLMERIEKIERSGANIKRLTNAIIEIIKESIIYDYGKDNTFLSILDAEQVCKVIDGTSTNKRLEMIDILMNTNEKYIHATSMISYLEIGLLKLVELFNDNDLYIEKELNKEMILRNTMIEPTYEKEKEQDIIVNSMYIKADDDFIETIEEVIPQVQIEAPMQQVTETQIEEPLEVVVEIPKETKPEVVTDSNTYKITNELILQLLVGANKPEKENDIHKFKQLNQYYLDMEFAKYAIILKNSTIIASANEYIIISVSSSIRSNEINEIDRNNEFSKFTKLLFNKQKKIFSLTIQESEECIDLFKEKLRANDLPSPIKITIQEDIEEDKVTKIKNLFEDIIIKED